jgi:DNA/RNA-binding domain of Phe-tRNA-synthetase-like protein
MEIQGVSVSDEVKSRFPGHALAAWKLSLGPADVVQARASGLLAEHLSDQGARPLLAAQIELWREVFKRMGARSGERSSIDNLHRTLEKRGALHDRLPGFVKLYNAMSLVTATPMGAYDAGSLTGSLRLEVGSTELTFTPMGRPDKRESIRPTEVYYRDASRIVCRMWNLGDCDETKVTELSTSILLVADLTGSDERIQAMLSRVRSELGHCSQIQAEYIDRW